MRESFSFQAHRNIKCTDESHSFRDLPVILLTGVNVRVTVQQQQAQYPPNVAYPGTQPQGPPTYTPHQGYHPQAPPQAGPQNYPMRAPNNYPAGAPPPYSG